MHTQEPPLIKIFEALCSTRLVRFSRNRWLALQLVGLTSWFEYMFITLGSFGLVEIDGFCCNWLGRLVGLSSDGPRWSNL